MTKLSILEQIIEASKGGYSATIKNKNGISQVVKIKENENGVVVQLNEMMLPGILVSRKEASWLTDVTLIEDVEITGYTFAGNLFGEPKIKVGQKFKIKGAKSLDKVGEYLNTTIHGSLRLQFKDAIIVFERKELEPYFE